MLRADHPGQVRPVLEAVERHARAGAWCVGFVRYEAASAFDSAFATHPADGPLAWFGVFGQATSWPEPSGPQHWTTGDWQPGLERAVFDQRIARVHQAIRDGETYQINLTAPLRSGFEGHAEAWFRALQRAQPQSYAAFIDTGEEQVLSVSPELFFDWRDGEIVSRPMKGTAPRGATAQEDLRQAEALVASEKERAENLMIVDLIRNDLSRIAEPHSVRVRDLFKTRAWPTVWQMTSDVLASTRPGIGLADVFGALFPCGSVTGVPKVRATQLIRELEDAPRGVYCGAVGVVRPGGAATFNVPIRTVQLRGASAICGIGSGVTIDARPQGEWDEWRNKRRFLDAAREPFELIETLRLEDGVFLHRSLHLSRMGRSAAHFGFVFDEGRALAALAGLAGQRPAGCWRVRLVLSADGSLVCEGFPLGETPGGARVQLAGAAMEAVHLDFLLHKTSRRGHYERHAPSDPAVFDTLLFNAAGEVTEFTRGNVLARLADGRWVTPPLSSGVLPGVGREMLLRQGRAVEEVLRVSDLPALLDLVFVNSLRGGIVVSLGG